MTSEREIAKYFLDVPRDNTHHLARIGIARAMRAVAPQARGDLVDIGCGLRPYQSLVNRACVFLDRRYPSARLCLTYLVIAERVAERSGDAVIGYDVATPRRGER